MSSEASLILPGLWVGTYLACATARQAGIDTLCVADPGSGGLDPEHGSICYHLPIMEGGKVRFSRLDAAADWLKDHWLRRKRPVLIHCMVGMERSPLTVVWFMTKVFPISFDQAYEWVKAHRPVVEDRRSWLEHQP